MDTYFLQFFSYEGNSIEDASKYDMGNGFSDTFDFCKNKGDFIWVDQQRSRFLYWKATTKLKLPVTKGLIYACCQYQSQTEMIKEYCFENPEIKFVIGGPGTLFISKLENLPSNIEVFRGTLEEYFNIPNFSYPWKLEIPKLFDNKIVCYSYTVDTRCYWQKCTYCESYEEEYKRIRPYSIMKKEFNSISGNKELIKIGSPALPPKLISLWFPELEFGDNITIDCFARPDLVTYKAFKETLPKIKKPENFIVQIGAEFLSQRMLKIMNKGLILDDVLNFVSLLVEYKVTIIPSFIIGWPELIENDVQELKKSIEVFPKNSTAYLNCLGVRTKGMPLSKIYPPLNNKDWWFPIQACNEEVRETNRKAFHILNNYFFIPFGDTMKNRLSLRIEDPII